MLIKITSLFDEEIYVGNIPDCQIQKLSRLFFDEFETSLYISFAGDDAFFYVAGEEFDVTICGEMRGFIKGWFHFLGK